MAAVEELNKLKVYIKLNNGSTSTGAPKTVTVSLPAVSKDQFLGENVQASNQKAINIINALVPCLDRTLNFIGKDATYEMYEE